MSVDLSEFHEELRAVARDLLAKAGATRSGQPPEPLDWPAVADAGWLGLEVPQSLGGAGGTFAEVAVVLHEMGRSPTPCAYLGSAVLGVGALNLIEASPARDGLLREVASGSRRIAVALSTGDEAAQDTPFDLAGSAGRFELVGQGSFVPDATGADRLLVLARDPASDLVVVDVDPTSPGLSRVEQPVLDSTRSLGTVTAERVDVAPDSVWRFAGHPETYGQRLLDRAALAMACDSLGLAEAMMDATVAYAGVRQQFGRPIGSFQAVKHACSDMLVQVSVCRELVSAAVRAVSSDDADAGVSVSMAKAHVCGAAVDIVGKAMQLHGGIGYTWESGIHAYLKRAVLNRSLFGAPALHRRRLGLRYLAAAPSGQG
jgi:alkylation response protein AidB-like acyl-CoA dehydrogenase